MGIILRNCNVVDIEDAKISHDRVVRIDGERITDIGEARDIRANQNDKVADLGGRYILPGLCNMHNNLSLDIPASKTDPNESQAISVLRLYQRAYAGLVSGSTTQRLLGELNAVDIPLRNMITSGFLKGPRLICAGRALGITGGHATPLGVDCDSPDEFRKAARRELMGGADFIKVFITGGIAKLEEGIAEQQMSREDMKAVADVTKMRGTYVAAHAGGSEPIIDGVEAGITCFEHAYLLNKEAAASMKRANAFFCPTLSATRSVDWKRSHGFAEWNIQKGLAAREAHDKSFRLAMQEGISIVCGADLPPADLNDGVNVTVREMEFMNEAGMSVIDTLRSATTTAAKLARMQDSLGLIKKGYLADIIAVQDDPLKNLRELEHISFVMKSGEIFRDDLAHN